MGKTNQESNADISYESLESSKDNFLASEDTAFICLPKDQPQLPVVKSFSSKHMRILKHKQQYRDYLKQKR